MWKSFEFFETKSTFPHQLLVLSKFATYTNTKYLKINSLVRNEQVDEVC